MERLEQALVRATRDVALAAVACLLGLAAITVADVALRYLFGKPIRGYTELRGAAHRGRRPPPFFRR